MQLSRAFEEKVNEMFMQGKIHGTTHLGIGQEANHAAVSAALREDDWMITTHRGHGHFLGKGGSPESLMAELFASKKGASSGLGGSMHLTDLEHHNMGSSGVVGGSVPISVGMAFALKYKNRSNIVVSMFGDGASNQGMTLESLNLASVWHVPVLFYCENNLYGMSGPARKFVGGGDLSARAQAFGIEAISVDGNCVSEIFDAVSDAADYVRNHQNPFFIESKTYRWLGHSKSDQRKYRTKEEEAEWKERCPILTYEKYLQDEHILSETAIEKMHDITYETIEEIADHCDGNDLLSMAEALSYVYCANTSEEPLCQL